jgi:hypothetical protein
LNWGLILGCNVVRFKSGKGMVQPEKGRLFAILVSVAWHLIWGLGVTRVIKAPDSAFFCASDLQSMVEDRK